MPQALVAIPGYNVISELRNTVAPRSLRARELESIDVVTLHLLPRASISRGDLVAAQAGVATYADLKHPRLARLRRIRADEETVLIETDHAGAETLECLLARDGRMDATRAFRIAEDLLVALVAGEMRGLYHGAIRPACVVLDRDGRAALDGFGFAALIPGPQDFYGVLNRFVPVAGDQRHSKDVFAVAALLFHMLEGRPPLPAEKARIRRDKWPTTAFSSLFDSVAPLDRTEAGALLRQIRELDPQSPTAIQQVLGTSLLDAVEPPPPAPKVERMEMARSSARKLLMNPAFPAVVPAVMGLFLALLFALPFLGDDGRPGAAMSHAQPLPQSTILAAPKAKAESATEKKTAPVVLAPRTDSDPLRDRVIALAEIGDYVGALEAMKGAKHWSADELHEEIGAVLAKAHERYKETYSLGRALAAEGHVGEAEREWENLDRYWPTPELRAMAREERAKLAEVAKELQAQRALIERERAWRKLDAQFIALARELTAEEEYDFAPRITKAEDFFQKAVKSEFLPVRDDAEALLQAVMFERDLFLLTQESIEKRHKRIAMGSVSSRFAAGEIVELTTVSIQVRRPDGTEVIPLARLTGAEKYAFFSQYRNVRTGRQDLGLAVMCIRWGMREQAIAELAAAETTDEPPSRPITVAKRILEEDK